MTITILTGSEGSLIAMLIYWLYDSNILSTVHPRLLLSPRQRNVSLLVLLLQQIPSLAGQVRIYVQALLLEKYDILILKIWNHYVAITSPFYLLQMKEANL